jgi:hypothetical protein
MIKSDDLYIQTHDKLQLCPTVHNYSGTLHVVLNFVSKFGFEADQRMGKCHERKTGARHFRKKRRIYLTPLNFFFRM